MKLFNAFRPIESWPFLILLFILIYGIDLIIARDFWVQDEARYGEIVREMLEHRQWLIPHLNGHPYPDKPVFYFWIVAGVGALIGNGELAFRLVTVASTAAAGFGVHRVALQLLGSTSAWWATALFLTTFLTLIVGHIIRMDMLLTAMAVAAWASLISGRKNPRALIHFWVFTLFGLMVKGPIALLFTLLPGIIWYLWEDGRAGLQALRLRRGGLILTILVITWAALVAGNGASGYLSQIWQEQLVGRAINSWSHREPIWFYLVLLPLLLMPWTPLIPLGFKQLWNDRPIAARSVTCFTLAPLVGISLISGKLFIYLEPLIPGLALAAGYAATITHRELAIPRSWSIPAVVFFAFLALTVGYITQRYLECPGRELGWLAALILLGCADIARRAIHTSRRVWIWRQLGLALILSGALFGVLITPLNPLYSGRAIGEYLAREVPATTPIGIIRTTRGIFNYYAQRTFTELSPEEVSDWRKANPEALLIFPSGLRLSPPECQVIRTFSVELIEYQLLRCDASRNS